MTDNTFAEIETVLQYMDPPYGSPWTPDRANGLSKLYRDAIFEFPEDVGRLILRELQTRISKRPSHADLHALGLSVMGLAPPSPNQAIMEVKHIMRTVGTTMVDPDNRDRRIYVEMPQFSHPAITATVVALGGWRHICTDETPPGIRWRQFMDAYEVAVKDVSIAASRSSVALVGARQKTIAAPTGEEV